MKYFVITFLTIVVYACQQSMPSDIITVNDTIVYKGKEYITIGAMTTDSLKYGEWTMIEDRDTSTILNYWNNLEHGEMKSFHPNGQINYLSTYKNGKLDGMEYRYDYDGNLVEESFFDNGEYIDERSTTYKYWLPDGSGSITWTGEHAGNYTWKDGEKIFVSKLTEQQIEKWKKENNIK